MEDEQYTKIERENRILMEKMYSIMKAQQSPKSMEFMPGMRLNKSQGPMVDCFLSETSVFPGQAVRLDSLNRESRRRDYMKIMEENMSILKRIQERKPNYQRSKWDRERVNVEGYLKNIKNDATTGYLSRTGSGSLRLPYSPNSSTRSDRSISSRASRAASSSSSRKRLPRQLPPREGTASRGMPDMSDSRGGLRSAPSSGSFSLSERSPPRQQEQQEQQEAPVLMGEINPLPTPTPAQPERVEFQPPSTFSSSTPTPSTGSSAGAAGARPASAAPLFKKGYKIGGGHYLVQFFADEIPNDDESFLADGSGVGIGSRGGLGGVTTQLRIRGIQISTGEQKRKNEVMEWTFSEARLRQMFNASQPWNLHPEGMGAWFTGLLVQLKEEDARRIEL
jgi:hypothetical protein